MNIKTLTISLALFLVILIIELVREEKLTFKYAFGWLVLALLGMLFVVFDKFVWSMARFFGFTLASNFIFFSLLCGFIFLCLIMTIFLCQQNKRNDIMAQKIGLLENQLENCKKAE